MTKKKKQKPFKHPRRSIEDLERIASQKPTGLSHAWLIGAAKRELKLRHYIE